MAPPAASGRHLSKFEKNGQKWFGSNFSGAAFCLPHQLVGVLLSYAMTFVRCRSSITNWASRIILERFDLESPNSIRASVPVQSHHTGYDVTSYFRSDVVANQTAKMPPPISSGQISQELFKRGSQNFTYLLGTNSFANLLDMTSIAASGRLQNAIKYSTKMRKKSRRQSIKYFGHCFTQNHQILQLHPRIPSLQPHWVWHHQLLLVGIYRSSKNERKCRLQRL